MYPNFFNKTEVTNIIDAINSSICLKLDFPARPKNYYPRSLQSPIHFDTIYEMQIFKTKVNNLNEHLNFLIKDFFQSSNELCASITSRIK